MEYRLFLTFFFSCETVFFHQIYWSSQHMVLADNKKKWFKCISLQNSCDDDNENLTVTIGWKNNGFSVFVKNHYNGNSFILQSQEDCSIFSLRVDSNVLRKRTNKHVVSKNFMCIFDVSSKSKNLWINFSESRSVFFFRELYIGFALEAQNYHVSSWLSM